MQSNWTIVKLGDIGKFSKGAGVSKSELVEDGVAAIRYGELYTKHHIKVSKIGSRISNESATFSVQVNYGDILFAGSGETIEEIGKSAVYLGVEDCYAGGDVIIFSPSKKHDPLFLAYLLNSPVVRRNLREMGQGQSVVHIYKRDLEQLRVSIPDKQEQSRIVHILETWNSYLEELEAKIKLKRELKNGLAQQLISGKKRLTGFNDNWQTNTLGDIATIKRGGSPRPIESFITTSDDGLNWLRIGDIKSGSRYITTTSQKIKPEGLKKTTMVHEGDFILSNSMSFGRPYIMKISACIHDGWLALMDINPAVNKSFLFYMLSSNKIQGKFKALSAGSGVQNLKKETVATVEIHLPSFEEQTAIAKILHDADDEIDLLVEERRLIAAQRDYLIHNLVTGKLRLPIAKADSKETTYA